MPTSARPTPVLPAVGSMMVAPGCRRPARLRRVDHAQRRAVLDAAAGVQELALRVEVGRAGGPEPPQVQQRRVAHQVEDAFRDARGGGGRGLGKDLVHAIREAITAPLARSGSRARASRTTRPVACAGGEIPRSAHKRGSDVDLADGAQLRPRGHARARDHERGQHLGALRVQAVQAPRGDALHDVAARRRPRGRSRGGARGTGPRPRDLRWPDRAPSPGGDRPRP